MKIILILITIFLPLSSAFPGEYYYVHMSGSVNKKNATLISRVFYSNDDVYCSAFMDYATTYNEEFYYGSSISKCYVNEYKTRKKAVVAKRKTIQISKANNFKVIENNFEGY
ncbi:hypothetical protein [Pseudoalteromonas arctica]|uniref:Uncharacterized protein n=1 Tax=Pseudoalteromonas arctica TaxID=394751 RepID=A0A7Y0DQ64_9GAMM|nr:hypothetical protein [Pseudoalteromonas arctica]NMM39490.1 hypothetical protein [Pseudoalteromonas arctica]